MLFAHLLLASALAAEPAAPVPAAPAGAPVDVAPVAPAEAGLTAAPAAAVAAALSRADAAYALRDEAGQLDEETAALEAAARVAPADAGVLWRQARHQAWLSEDPAIPKERKSELGKVAWDLADRAAAVDPTRVEPWFYAMSGIGNYSLGIGVISALARGIEGKFRDRLGRAEKVDPAFDRGAIPCAWGRFFYELPWPKHDAKKSEQALRTAMAMNPDNVRAHVYLGDLHLDEGRKAEARAEYQAALAKPPGQYDAPEERRWQGVARQALARLGGG
jgi:tetratricopeptide (TPR) repeat protein